MTNKPYTPPLKSPSPLGRAGVGLNPPYTVSHVVITPQLLTVLEQKPRGRYSRSDAYFDLLGRAMASKPLSMMPKTAAAELLSTFTTTITELAEQWGWQRATVRKFLSDLCDIGQIEREDNYKSIDIEFTALRYKWDDDVVVNDKCVADHDSNPASWSTAEASQEQLRLCRQLYDELFSDMNEQIRNHAFTPQVLHAIYRAYFNICGDGAVWHKYVDQMKTGNDLSLKVYGDIAVGKSAQAIEQFFIRFGKLVF